MLGKNIFYAQSGGVTAVINVTACGVLESARKQQAVGAVGRVFAGRNGILGALREELIDTSRYSDAAIARLRATPGSAFGSCRYKLKTAATAAGDYRRICDVFQAHDIGIFLYNGGGDSLDTALRLQQYAGQHSFPLQVIGLPKTIDNDLMATDNCPGFGSVAKYVALSVREAAFDVMSMCATSTKVFIMEVMGRHAGWIAAAAGLAAEPGDALPLVILFPEVPFQADRFCAEVKAAVGRYGYCVVVVSEGIKNPEGKFLSEMGAADAFGHAQLGGVAPVIASLINATLAFKCHWAVADYLQRSARHVASGTDVEQAYAIGKAGVDFAVAGKNGLLPILVRRPGSTYGWHIGEAPLMVAANAERLLPAEYISTDGFGITAAARAYLAPLIQGEAVPEYRAGLPHYVRLEHELVPPKCSPYPG